MQQLWDHLRLQMPVAGLATLDDNVKSHVWSLLHERPQDVGVMRRLPGQFDR